MKALKEKRVSLRSLFRRSLVILSLLALAFASCSDSGGSDSTPSTPTPSNPPIEPPAKTVASMRVIEHPYLPSYEGAYPDLTGLKVQIFWSDGSEPEYVVDTTKFLVYPSVAYVDAGYDNANPRTIDKFSKTGQYLIQYKLDPYYNASGPRANVYIPAVVAIVNGDYAPTEVAIAGKLPYIFEDQEIDPADLDLYATYESDPTIATVAATKPKDYYSPYFDLLGTLAIGAEPGPDDKWLPWPTNTGTEKLAKKISPQRDVWRITQNKEVEYLIRSPKGDPNPVGVKVNVEKYYSVDSIKVTGGDFTKIKIYADDPKFNEYADPRAPTGGTIPTAYPNWKGDTTASNPYRKPVDLKVGENWLWKLKEAGVTFMVTYYDKKENDGGKGPTRPITMDDYIRAVYSTNKEGVANASLPIPEGREQSANTPSTIKLLVSDVITSIAEEYPLSLRLYYYSRNIKGGSGEGLVDLKIDAENGVDYVKPNFAIVPITANQVIYTYAGIRKARKDDTNFETNDIPARVPSNLPEPYNRNNAYQAFQTYYNVLWIYSNEARGEPNMEVKGKWTTYVDSSSGATIKDNVYVEFDNTAVEEGAEDPRVCVIGFDRPISGQFEETAQEEVEFPYIMMP